MAIHEISVTSSKMSFDGEYKLVYDIRVQGLGFSDV